MSPASIGTARRGPDTVAIIGSGPAGCYTAQAVRRLRPNAEIVVIERLPVPYGLVRYGIAADHQGTKKVSRQFDRLFERDRVHFFGNVTVASEAGGDAGGGVAGAGGSDTSPGGCVTLSQLRKRFDAVVLATGLPGDRRLGVPGESLAGVYGSGAFTRHLNGHPSVALGRFDVGQDVVVVGAGNVAIDVIRLLAGRSDNWVGSDLHPRTETSTLSGRVRRITLLARAAQANVRCDAAMIRELARLPNVAFTVTGECCVEGSPAARAISELATASVGQPRMTVELRFGATPVRFIGHNRVRAVEVATANGARDIVEASSVITAIGFDTGAGSGGVGAAGEPGVFTVGWVRNGPRGGLPDARADGKRVAGDIDAYLSSLAATPTRAGFASLRALLPQQTVVDFERWRRIDAFEISSARPERVRQKLLTVEDMLAVAGGGIVQPERLSA